MNRRPGGTARFAGSGVASSFVLAAAATILIIIPAPSAANAWPAPGDSVALPLRVELKTWSTIHASQIIPWWDDYIKVIDTSGRTRYVSRFEIVSIRDARGRDLKNQILLGRQSYGAEPAKPPKPPPPRVPESYRVAVAGQDTLHAALVGYWPGDYVRIIDGGGSTRYVPTYRVLAVMDTSGVDVTNRILEECKSVGTAPPELRPWRPPPRPRSPLSGFIANGAVLVRTGAFDPNRVGSVRLQVDLGGMAQVGDRYGLGATLFYAGDDEIMDFGIKARARRLLGHSFMVDLAPGAILGTDTQRSTHTSVPAFVCEADVTFKGWLSLTGQVEARDWKYTTYSWAPGPAPWPDYNVGYTTQESERDVAWYVGLKLGGKGGIPAACLASVAMAAINSMTETYAIPTP